MGNTTNCKAVQTHAPGGPVKSSNISNGTFWVQGMAWDILPGNWTGQCAPIFISDHTFKITMDATSTSTSTTRKRRSTPDLKQYDSIWGSDVPEEFKLWTERQKVLNASCKFNDKRDATQGSIGHDSRRERRKSDDGTDSALDASAAASPLPPAAAAFAVPLELPDFWLHDPPLWFVHVEAQFALRGISADDTKYHQVVASLDPLATRRVLPLLRDPPARGKYAALKELLLQRYALSDAERAEKLLSLSGLGGGTALELMERMLSFLGPDDGGFLFAHIFLRQLPAAVRAGLANSPLLGTKDYRSLAEDADRILLATRAFHDHDLVPASPPTSPLTCPDVSAPSLAAKVSDPWSGRQQRQLAAISEFTTDIQHVAGKSNCVADCLSRALVSPVYVGIDFDAMAADQRADPDILALRFEQTGLVLEDRAVWNGGPSLLCDVSTGRPRPVVPLSWRRRVFDSVHALSHPGVRASVKLVSSRFVWPGLRRSVKEWAAACIPCQRTKIHRHTQARLESFRVPGRRFDHVHVDLVGPLPQSQVKEDLGVSPAELVLDQPLRVPGEFLPESPPPCFAPSVLSLRPPRDSFSLPGPVHHCLPDTFVPRSLDSSQFVFVRHDAHRPPLRPLYDGPFRVIQPGRKHFLLDFGGRQETVSIDRLKPAHVLQDDQLVPAQAPRHGRPHSTGLDNPASSSGSTSHLAGPELSSASPGRPCQSGPQARFPSASSPPPRFSCSGRLIKARVLD
ncbi:unnamed protein product [Oreochromis niloticus]|nr:unnamed protein product [Mustela putorius furo]